MNENPEGTPNPLNPNPTPVGQGAAPTGATMPTEPATPTPVVAPAPQPVVEPAATEIPVNRPAMSAPVVQPVADPAPQPAVAPIAQSTQPAQTAEEPKGSVVEPAEKKSKSLIVILIVFIVALVGAVVAALVVFNPFGLLGGSSDDRVPTAIAKLFSADAPTNVKMSGSIILTNNDETSPVSTVDVTFVSEQNTISSAQSANASITLTFADESEFSFEADEVHTEGGDLYIRLNDVAGALEDYKDMLTESTDCTVDENGDATCETETDGEVVVMPLIDTIGIFEIIDNQWIRISGSDFSVLTDVADVDSPAQCLIDTMGDLSNYETDITNAYRNNQFIEYTTENLTVAKKKDNLYLLSVNAGKFADFVNALPGGFMNSLYACADGVASSGTISTADANQIVSMLPTIYVEIDENDMFTRVYLKAASTDGDTSAIADISLSYPEKITITEPSEYIDLNTLLSNLLSGLFDTEIVEVTE